MKKIVLFLFLIIGVDCYSQTNTISKSDIANMDSLVKEADGFWRVRYSDGNIMMEGKLKRKWSFYYFRFINVPDGVWSFFSREGFLVKTEEYKRGKLVRVKMYPLHPT